MADLNAIGIVASDPARSIAFYRLLGVDFPEDGEGHIEATLPNGVRFMLDDEEVIRSFRPDWSAGARPRWTSSGVASGRPASTPRRSLGTRSGDSATRSCATPTACRSTSSRRSRALVRRLSES